MRYALFFLLTSFSLLTNAQLAFTDALKLNRNVVQAGVVDVDSLGFFVMEEEQAKDELIHISRYGHADLRLTWKKTFNLSSLTGKDQRFAGLAHLNDHFVLFTSGYNRDHDRYYAYGLQISNDGEVVGSPVLIHTTGTGGRTSAPQVQWRISPDEKRVLIFFEPEDAVKTEQAIGLKMYSHDLDLLWEKDLQLPYENDIVQVHHYAIDNVGGIYFLSGDIPRKSTTHFEQPQMGRYAVFYYSFEGNKLKEYDVSLKEKQVVSVAFDVRENGELVIGGYYSNDFSLDVAGTFIFQLSKGAEAITSASYAPFSKEFLGKFMNEREIKRSPGLPGLYLDHLIIAPDSSIILVGEQYSVAEQFTHDISTGRQIMEYIYHFDDIAITRIKKDGKTQWSKRIPKQQYAYSQDRSCSYACYFSNDEIRIVFNDDDENEKYLNENPDGIARTWFNARMGVTSEVRVNSEGAITRRTLLNNDQTDIVFYPGISSESPYLRPVLGYEGSKIMKFTSLR